MNKSSNILGWVGVGLILLAYAGVSSSQLQASGWLYQIMNLLGSLFLIIETWRKKDYQPMVLNVVWASIAVISLLSLAL